jgi:hypothetical protein
MIIPLKTKLGSEGMLKASVSVSVLVNDLMEYIQTCSNKESNCNILDFLSKKEKLSAIA